MVSIKLVTGDITQIQSDAIITAINSEGLWFGGIDAAIQKAAGAMYHSQAAQGELKDLNVFVALGDRTQHHGKFDNVIFVVDDLQSPLHQVIKKGLDAADDAGFKTVTIPAIRTGVMLGVIEKSLEDVAVEYMAAIKDYLDEKKDDTVIQNIIFVIYNNPRLENILRNFLNEITG